MATLRGAANTTTMNLSCKRYVNGKQRLAGHSPLTELCTELSHTQTATVNGTIQTWPGGAFQILYEPFRVTAKAASEKSLQIGAVEPHFFLLLHYCLC